MKLSGRISRKFRAYQECDICGTRSRWKAKCWDEEDLADVYYACKKCHDNYSCCDCPKTKNSFVLNLWKEMARKQKTTHGGSN